MEKANLDGVSGYYDEATKAFYDSKDIAKANLDGVSGYYHNPSKSFIPAKRHEEALTSGSRVEAAQQYRGTPVQKGMPASVAEVPPQGFDPKDLASAPLYIADGAAAIASGVGNFTVSKLAMLLQYPGEFISNSKDAVKNASQFGQRIADYLVPKYEAMTKGGKTVERAAMAQFEVADKALREAMKVAKIPEEYIEAVMEGVYVGMAALPIGKAAMPKAPELIKRPMTLGEKFDERFDPEMQESGVPVIQSKAGPTLPDKGVGARAAGSPRETPTDTVQLYESLSQKIPSNFEGRKKNMETALDKIHGAKESVAKSIDRVKLLFNDLKKDKEAFKPTTFDEAFGEYDLQAQQASYEIHRLSDALEKNVNARAQEAMSKFVESEGSEKTLRDRAEQLSKKADELETLKEDLDKGTVRHDTLTDEQKRDLKKVSIAELRKEAQRNLDALNLTPEEKIALQNIQERVRVAGQEAHEMGVIEGMVDNYVHRRIKKGSRDEIQAMANLYSRKFKVDPAQTFHRVFDTDFEATMMGFELKSHGIGERSAEYLWSTYEAIATKKLINNLLNMKHADGNPLAIVNEGGRRINPALWNRMHEVAELFPQHMEPELPHKGYAHIENAGFQFYKWPEKMKDGTPIYLDGEIRVHPDIAKVIRATYERSKIREHAVGKWVMEKQQYMKASMLQAIPTPFHQTTLIFHSFEHAHSWKAIQDAFKPGPIDFENPVTQGLIKHGALMLADMNAVEAFMDGAKRGGIAEHIPGLGDYSNRYSSQLFHEFIPRLKLAVAKEMFERHRRDYPNLTDAQHFYYAGKMANAAFGELNYKRMGRSKTFQDVLRLGLLAPDFLEARARFAGQGVMPYMWKEQGGALFRGLLYVYGTARLLNMMANDGDPVWEEPLGVKIGGKVYGLRTIQGDILHLFANTSSFVYWRLNPATVKPIYQLMSGRDIQGHLRSKTENFLDFAKGYVPIALQGFINPRDYLDWYDNVVTWGGGTAKKYRSPAEKKMLDIQTKQFSSSTPEEREVWKTKDALGKELAKDPVKGFEKIAAAMEGEQPKISEAGAKNLMKMRGMKFDSPSGKWVEERKPYSDLEKHFYQLKSKDLSVNSVELLADVYDNMKPEERSAVNDIFYQKIVNQLKYNKKNANVMNKIVRRVRETINKLPEQEKAKWEAALAGIEI